MYCYFICKSKIFLLHVLLFYLQIQDIFITCIAILSANPGNFYHMYCYECICLCPELDAINIIIIIIIIIKSIYSTLKSETTF